MRSRDAVGVWRDKRVISVTETSIKRGMYDQSLCAGFDGGAD